MRTTWALVPVVAALMLGAVGPPVALSSEAAGPLVDVRLSDGTLLRGRVLSEDETRIVVESVVLGRLTIDRAHVESVVEVEVEGEPAASRDEAEPPPDDLDVGRDPDRNTVMLGPTPETLPAGNSYFRNFELFILNLGFAPTDDVNVSIGTIFPVSSEVRSLSGGFKVRLLPREKYGLGVAVAANGTWLGDEKFGSVIGIIGVGSDRSSLNLSVHRTFSEGEDFAFFIVGGDVQAGNGFKLLAEYGNSTAAVLTDEDFVGMINVGFRIFGERTSFSLSGFRPLVEDTGSFIAFPVAMYSRHF